MTRINSAIPVSALTDEHLLSEHREIKRLPFLYAKRKDSKVLSKSPECFVLGKGHVLFFLDKPLFCYYRYRDIYIELKKRKMNVSWMGGNWFEKYPAKSMVLKSVEYTPTEIEKELLIERIKQRILESPKKFWHYFGKSVTKEEAVNILTSCNDIYQNKGNIKFIQMS